MELSLPASTTAFSSTSVPRDGQIRLQDVTLSDHQRPRSLDGNDGVGPRRMDKVPSKQHVVDQRKPPRHVSNSMIPELSWAVVAPNFKRSFTGNRTFGAHW